MRRSKWLGVVAILSALALAACADDEPRLGNPLDTPEAPPPPGLDPALVALGERVYADNCAACHRPDLSGDPDWTTPNPDGSYPPPPHDSSGHTWHHPDGLLFEIIRDGTGFEQTRMPIFAGVLGDEEIRAVIEFFKSRWGTEERAFQWQVTWQDGP
ncbi:MAG: cytochrome c [Acidimicrobiia bacterium]|nr:MAG: cytochrome c [Acidimicrobiia bacterium]